MRGNHGGTKKSPYAEPVEARTALIQATLSEGLGTRRNSRRETWEIVDDLPGKTPSLRRQVAEARTWPPEYGRDAAQAVSTNP